MNSVEKKRSLSPYLLVILSFVGVILIGSALLTCPFSHIDGKWGNFLDSFFIATSATCVTGLSVYANGIAGELTFIGQLVVLIMIQIGGLGFITIFAFIISIFQRRLKFKDRLFLSQAVNSNSVSQVSQFVIRVVIIVLFCEILGFLLGLPVFLSIKNHSVLEVLWMDLFTSVSAFNNAGFDLFGSDSLIRIASNPIVYNLPTWAYYYLLSYIMVLIVLGGISFVVIIEIVFNHKKPRQWSAFTRIVLLTTAILLVFGMGGFMLTDGINGNIDPFHALFQSVTTRTAGFASVNQDELSTAGKTLTCFLMFIGGSPIGTAGGIKTTTLFMIVISFVSFIRGKSIVAFKRQYSRISVIKAMSIVFLAIVLAIVSFQFIISFEGSREEINTERALFEVFSGFGTVGLSTGITPILSSGSKIVLCLLMFFGRLGPITMFQIFQRNMDKEEKKHFKYIETDVIIG